MKIPTFSKLVLCLLIPQAAGFVGSLFTGSALTIWYDGLSKAPLTPPDWTFGVVWTILYLLMGIAAFLVWEKGTKKSLVRNALGIFALQLFMNTLWSVIFFGLYNPGAALLDIISLWLSVLATIIVFYRIHRTAAWLLVPYIAWISFAAYLNWYIWAFN